MGSSDGRIVGTTKIVDHGPDAARYNVVVVAEGFQLGELSGFVERAAAFADKLRCTPPFSSLFQAFNVYRLDVISDESGAADPRACGGSGADPATFFDATFCSRGIDRLLVVDWTLLLTEVSQQLPAWHTIAVLVNSKKYGGSGQSGGDGSVAVFSSAPQADEIALHELGHSVFDLADEYDYWDSCETDVGQDRHPPGEPPHPNVTLERDRNRIKWRDLVDPATSVPTMTNPECSECDTRPSPVADGTVGAFEGAHYYHCGAFRPEYDCWMRSLGQPFCAVCSRTIEHGLQPFLPAEP